MLSNRAATITSSRGKPRSINPDDDTRLETALFESIEEANGTSREEFDGPLINSLFSHRIDNRNHGSKLSKNEKIDAQGQRRPYSSASALQHYLYKYGVKKRFHITGLTCTSNCPKKKWPVWVSEISWHYAPINCLQSSNQIFTEPH